MTEVPRTKLAPEFFLPSARRTLRARTGSPRAHVLEKNENLSARTRILEVAILLLEVGR